MDAELIRRVRRFNRTVTQRVGALQDHYLARDRPLGESRLLWEIGEDGCEVRMLRARLNLDSGYLSRLLRSLEANALIEVGPSNNDQRVRSARLTKKGSAERALLDRRSDALAWSMLDQLDEFQRERLVAAMDDVERLLTVALVQIDSIDPAQTDAQHCLDEYFAELDRRFEAGFDPARSISAELDEMRPPAGAFLVAKSRGEAIGCGALKFHTDAPTEVKRMWIDPRSRGLGVGRRLLAELEQRALDRGDRRLRLETNKVLTEAIAMYRAAGYREVEAFNDEPYAHHWFEKHID